MGKLKGWLRFQETEKVEWSEELKFQGLLIPNARNGAQPLIVHFNKFIY